MDSQCHLIRLLCFKLKYLFQFPSSLSTCRIDRAAIQDVEIDGIVIPAGATVTAMAYAIHMDPEIYPDPMTFDPERLVSSRHVPLCRAYCSGEVYLSIN